MKKLLLFAIFILSGAVFAQQFEWAAQTNGLSGEEGKRICLDGKGNIYTAGSSNGNSVLHTHAITKGDFVAKFSGTGQCLWAKNIAGSIADIESDKYGNLYITGTFTGTATFGQGSLISTGLKDMYVAKLDANGTALWAHKAGSKKDDEPIAIAVDEHENVYITGNFSDTIYFDTIRAINSGDHNVFLTKYNSAGIAVWANNAHTVYSASSTPDIRSFDVLIDSGQIIWFSGKLLTVNLLSD